jgi:hypothetical protein
MYPNTISNISMDMSSRCLSWLATTMVFNAGDAWLQQHMVMILLLHAACCCVAFCSCLGLPAGALQPDLSWDCSGAMYIHAP